jgi:RNA polymerase sigma-70 factor (ECF subfamily)
MFSAPERRKPRRISAAADNITAEKQLGPRDQNQLGHPQAGGMTPEQRTEREAMLRQAVLAGDEAAWRTWCLEAFDELDRYVFWRCGQRRDQADEVVQETWLTAVRKIRRFNPAQASFLAWLRGIAANVRRNHQRRVRRIALHEISNNGHADPASQPIANDREDASRRIAAALDALPERQETVLRAKYLDGLSVAQIAAAWNETPKTIESLLTRARQAFREGFRQMQLEE